MNARTNLCSAAGRGTHFLLATLVLLLLGLIITMMMSSLRMIIPMIAKIPNSIAAMTKTSTQLL